MSETDAIKSSVSRPSVTAYRKRTALTAMLTLEACTSPEKTDT
jgi:hypothetical protein